MLQYKKPLLGYGKVMGAAFLAGCMGLAGQHAWKAAHGADSGQQQRSLSGVSPASSLHPVAAAMPKLAPPSAAKAIRKNLQSLAGLASWYGSVLDGHTTASGEIFHKDELTACHRTLPFGTWVRVIALETGRSVVVKINDRGVLSPDRVIDLSSGAAKELGILRSGVAHVRLQVLKHKPEETEGEPASDF